MRAPADSGRPKTSRSPSTTAKESRASSAPPRSAASPRAPARHTSARSASADGSSRRSGLSSGDSALHPDLRDAAITRPYHRDWRHDMRITPQLILATGIAAVTLLAADRFDKVVRNDFFLGFSGNDAALDRAMAI